jgi:regulation of enolase protein 1 (concanavalin A-like superfamily)
MRDCVFWGSALLLCLLVFSGLAIAAIGDTLGTNGVTAATAFKSDDFNAYNLNTRIWTFSDPIGDATLLLTGTKTTNACLSIFLPAGVTHDLYTQNNTAPRILQPTSNTDFTIEVKFNSAVSQAYQLQGVLIQASPTTLLRFDFSSDGTQTMAFAASTTDGFATPPTVQIPLTGVAANNTAPLYMRVQRVGSTWTMLYSTGGIAFTVAGSFTFVLTVSQVGLFAANGGTSIPSHTVLVDYFFNTAAPISPEDGSTVVDSLPPLVYDLQSVAGATDIKVTWKTDERSKTRFDYSKNMSYGTTITDDTLRTSHTILLSNLSTNTKYNFRVIATDSLGHKDTTAGLSDTTYTKTPTTITLWGGNSMTFGKIGTPQRYVNILGNITDPAGVDSVYYRLNGGSPIRLSLGPDGRRLQRAGDFNIDIPYAALAYGSNSIVLTTKNAFNERRDTTITVRDSSKAVWPIPYTVAFGAAKSLTDSVQIVDGRWTVTSGYAQVLERGYDRILAIGDTTWKDYEITVRFKVTGMDSTLLGYGAPSGGPAMALLMRWMGHTNNPISGKQPLEGYLPLGAFAALSWTTLTTQQWELYGNNLVLKDTRTDLMLSFDTLYYFKMQVRTITGQGGFYRLKAWSASQAEPAAWLLNAQEGLTDPQNGSVVIVAHHVNCWVDNVTVTAPPVDNLPPTMSNIATEGSATSSYITVTTNEPARILVNYGLTAAYGMVASPDSLLTLAHGVPITGLKSATLYHFRIVATDNAGNAGFTQDSVFTTLPPALPTLLTSDEFNSTTLNPEWIFADPLGGASYSTPDTVVKLNVPAGSEHDIWTGGYNAPRIMQPTNNTDFVVQVKWNSAISGSPTETRMQGIAAEQDVNTLIRFDYTANEDGTYIFAATFHNGFLRDSIQTRVLTLIPGATGIQPLYMRVAREGNIWSQWYSLDGSTWVLATRFHFAMTPTAVGLMAGNGGSSPPGFVSSVDYFHVIQLPTDVVPTLGLPAAFALEQNYPNPFNPATTIRYQISQTSDVHIIVYDILGREVMRLVNERKAAGTYTAEFKAQTLSSGVYIYQMRAGDFVSTRKMLLIK